MDHFVDWVLLPARLNGPQRRYILSHRQDLRPGHLFDQSIAFLMVTVRMISQQNFDIGKLEPELLD
jgi:hypothetical protein